MSTYRSEEEQVEVIKRWWKEYGFATITGIILAIILVLGWQYYQRYEIANTQQASFVYQELIGIQMNPDKAKNNADAVSAYANDLITHYAHTPYAKLASLWLAKVAVDQRKLNDAMGHLEWVMSHTSSHDALHAIAQIRLARIYLAQNQPQDVLTLLNNFSNKDYMGVALAAKGDAYLKLNQVHDARDAYQQALAALPVDAPLYKMVQVKLANLSV
jgi:predicted negative regulator of RcsB-dependent stress response